MELDSTELPSTAKDVAALTSFLDHLDQRIGKIIITSQRINSTQDMNVQLVPTKSLQTSYIRIPEVHIEDNDVGLRLRRDMNDDGRRHASGQPIPYVAFRSRSANAGVAELFGHLSEGGQIIS
jgi:aminoglycoside/choline kinase family phosphotransferase